MRIPADVDEAGTALDSFASVPRGNLRISAPFTFVVAILSPMLTSFFACYPEARVVLDIPVEEADLVIRVTGALPDGDLIARHRLTTESWTCASPGYLAARGVPSRFADLSRHSLIAYANGPTKWSFRLSDGAIKEIAFRPANVVSDSAALKPMLVGGGGIGRLPDFIAKDAVATGALVPLFPETVGDVYEVHALYTSHRSLSALDTLTTPNSAGNGCFCWGFAAMVLP